MRRPVAALILIASFLTFLLTGPALAIPFDDTAKGNIVATMRQHIDLSRHGRSRRRDDKR